jgi:hypothetical protein
VLKKINKLKRDKDLVYVFKARPWKHQGPNGWYFLTVPKAMSSKIRKSHLSSEEGWGRLRAFCKIGNTKWQTSIWFDTKRGSYLLPLKSEIRAKEKIEIGRTTTCSLELENSEQSPFLIF